MNPTDTNQASEDGDLRDILSKVLCDGQNQIHDLLGGTSTPEEVTDRMYAALDYWQPKTEAIIRNEKLKLLAEVRERVVGSTVRVKPVNEVQDERDLIENHHKAIAVNECIYRQRENLTKLEAEL